MANVAIITDSNSGITQNEAKELGIRVVPMPFMIDGEEYLEDITLTQEQFYEKLQGEANVCTSQPSIGFVNSVWDEALESYDEVVYIPMSSGLSASCENAKSAAEKYEGKVQVGNPYVSGAKVEGKVVAHGKGKKITVFKYKPKKNERKTQGHRQEYTKVEITAVNAK